jgi:hypothetical protein
MNIPSQAYPIIILQDRYQGVYSGGGWIACCEADELHDGSPRHEWLIQSGPNGDDTEAATFWANAPDWVAAGVSPDLAVASLLNKLT